MPSRIPFLDTNVLSLDALDRCPADGTWLAVLGHPIKHSISPAMHNAALAELAVSDTRFSRWRYLRFDIPPAELPDALQRFHRAGFLGLNLTVPHKVIAFDHVAEVDHAARPIGAVNTLRRTPNGWEGFNTDGYGLAMGLRQTLAAELSGAHIVLLGAGGAARGAAVECLQRGCASLSIGNRTAANLDTLLTQLAPLAGTIPLRSFDPREPSADLPEGAWVINATSAGLRPEDPLPLDLATLRHPRGVFDMIYNPAETPLLRQARERGIPAANGLAMLVHQGARALEIWTGREVPVSAMRRAAEQGIAGK